MRKWITLAGILIGILLCTPTQAGDKAQEIFGQAGDKKLFVTRDSSNAFSPALLGDQATLFLATDLTGITAGSGDLLVKVKLYSRELGTWHVSPDSLLDTIPAADANKTAWNYVKLEDLAGWSYADSAKFIFTSGDSLRLRALIDGR